MTIHKTTLKHLLILIGLCYLFFMWGNSVLDLTNPDEVFYAQTAKEMIQKKTWIVPYLFGEPQFEKPIMTYWCLRLGYILFGVSPFGARFFPALFGLLGVLVLYGLGWVAYGDRKKAFVCAFVLMSSGLYLGLARTVFTDLIFSVFILSSLASFYWGFERPEKRGLGLFLFHVFAGLAVLTKGPLGFLLPLLTVLLFLALRRQMRFFFCRASLFGFLAMLAIALPWYAFMMRTYGNSFIQEFFINDHIRRVFEAEHPMSDTWYFYPLSMVLCMFPWAFFTAFSAFQFFRDARRIRASSFSVFLFSWIAVVFVVFQVAHSKLVSYIFPLFPALALMTGDFLDRAIRSEDTKILSVLSLVSWFTVLCLPVGVLVSSIIYAQFVPSKGPVYGFVALCGLLLAAMFVFIRKKKFMINILFLAFQLPLILGFVFFSHESVNMYAASRGPAEFLLQNAQVDNKILCAKFFARGVRFYTDKEVAVVNIGGTNFFSPHPIPYLNTEEKLQQFLESQKVTYGIVDENVMGVLERQDQKRFMVETLKQIGDEFVVKITSY